ncbi:MAG: helix-turn-helix domain-containing protein [Victivallales bacterium]|nr:helix-turn-helix domain-containing protein [Victivallales bacterium]
MKPQAADFSREQLLARWYRRQPPNWATRCWLAIHDLVLEASARLDQCAADLRTGQYALKEIARRHGFCDASSLCNAFRRVFKCTPTTF